MTRTLIVCVFLGLFFASVSNQASSTGRTQTIVRTVHINTPGPNSSRYFYFPFQVTRATRKIRISYDYDRTNNTLDLGLLEPKFSNKPGDTAGFRGWSGGRRSDIFVEKNSATPGYVPGEIVPGTWRVILGLYKVAPSGVDVTFKIELDQDETLEAKLDLTRKSQPLNRSASFAGAELRWVNGDLHMHTQHSDGDWTVAELTSAARDSGLDFIAITDHNTSSHHREIDDLKAETPLVLRGEELTTYGGHINIWGVASGGLVDFRVTPGNQKELSTVLAQARKNGWLTSINHPFAFCDGCRFTYDKDAHDFDAIEVWNGSWDPSDDMSLMLWDQLLQKGRQITAVASSDSHRAASPIGRPTTHVAIRSQLAPETVLPAVRAGHVYLTNKPNAPIVTFEAEDTSNHRKYIAGDVVTPGTTVQFKIAVSQLPQGAVVSLMSDGKTLRTLGPGEETLQVTPQTGTYYRLEVRDENGLMLALTNPIYVETLEAKTPLASQTVSLTRAAEVTLDLTATSPGASWATKDAESATLTIDVDNEYNQDLMLWAGERPYTYKLMLGKLGPGKHEVKVSLSRGRSAVHAQNARIVSMRSLPQYRTQADEMALTNSPVLYQRPNTIDKFSDLPLLMYYEVEPVSKNEFVVRYTMIFSNEDGGTQTAALMARWGRAADIEWVYEFRARDGKIVEESFQGVSHEKKPFKGTRINGSHPVLWVASDNNNFADNGNPTPRFALFPVAVDLREATRESVLDANPLIYRTIAQELTREGKLILNTADPNTISDPRNYVYVDVRATQQHSAISVSVTDGRTGNISESDQNNEKLRIDRTGYFRTAIRMADLESAASISTVTVNCHSKTGESCKDVAIVSVSTLDQQYHPKFFHLPRRVAQTLKPNTSLTLNLR